MEQIMGGIWPQGHRIDSVEQLSKRFGVGRSSVREALMLLKARGIVDVRHGEGTYVLRDKEADNGPLPVVRDATALAEWLELRLVLEVEGSRLAAQRATADQLQRMEAELEAMRHFPAEENLEQSDIRFHQAIAAASGNRLLAQTLGGLFSSMSHSMRESRRLWQFSEEEKTIRLYEEHAAIFLAIQEGDDQLAAARMSSHLNKAGQTLRSLFLPGGRL